MKTQFEMMKEEEAKSSEAAAIKEQQKKVEAYTQAIKNDIQINTMCVPSDQTFNKTIEAQRRQLEAQRRQHLDETQSMRVVALNEACSVFKTFVESQENVGVDYKVITHMAKTFAKFLIDEE
jgi:hypothetical protein